MYIASEKRSLQKEMKAHKRHKWKYSLLLRAFAPEMFLRVNFCKDQYDKHHFFAKK